MDLNAANDRKFNGETDATDPSVPVAVQPAPKCARETPVLRLEVAPPNDREMGRRTKPTLLGATMKPMREYGKRTNGTPGLNALMELDPSGAKRNALLKIDPIALSPTSNVVHQSHMSPPVSAILMRCTCGQLRGNIARPERSWRVICMCNDCQSYAHWLKRDSDILDVHGGTELLQVSPCQLQLTQGLLHLACMRLSPKGLCRWYVRCCNTPIGNTLFNARVPFVGIPTACIDPAPPGLDACVGPVRFRVYARDAQNPPAEGMHTGTLGLGAQTVLRLAKAFVRREYRDSPFWKKSGEPVCEPLILSEAERTALRQKVANP